MEIVNNFTTERGGNSQAASTTAQENSESESVAVENEAEMSHEQDAQLEQQVCLS
jgi:hypothetical protein